MTIKKLKALLDKMGAEHENTQVLVELPLVYSKDDNSWQKEQEHAIFGGIEDGYLIIRPLSNIFKLAQIQSEVQAGK